MKYYPYGNGCLKKMTNNNPFERKREYIILDRIDIQVEIEPMEFDDMANRAPAERSADIRRRVKGAREI